MARISTPRKRLRKAPSAIGLTSRASQSGQRHQQEGEQPSRIKRFEESAFFRVIYILATVTTPVAVGFAGWQISMAVEQNRQQAQDREQQLINQARTDLLTPAGGESGKGQALQTLLDKNQPVSNLALSCRTIGIWDPVLNECAVRPLFSSVDFAWGQRNTYIPIVSTQDPRLSKDVGSLESREFGTSTPSFRQVQFTYSNFTATEVDHRHFDDVIFVKGNFRGADILILENDNSRFRSSDFTGATIQIASGQPFPEGNVSGALINLLENPGREDASNSVQWEHGGTSSQATMQSPAPEAEDNSLSPLPNWAWADTPPVILLPDLDIRRNAGIWKISKARPPTQNETELIKTYFARIALCDPDTRLPRQDATTPSISDRIMKTVGANEKREDSWYSADAEFEPKATTNPGFHGYFALPNGDIIQIKSTATNAAEMVCVSLSYEDAKARWPDRYI